MLSEKLAKFHISFRLAISTILTLLLVGTVAVTGILSYVNLTRDTKDLSAQVLDQTSLRISFWVGNLLYKAHDQNVMNRSLLGTIKLNKESLTKLAHYWQRVMEAQPVFTFLSVDLESDVLLSIERMRDGEFTIREAHVDRKNRTIDILDFWPADYPKRKFYARKKIEMTSTAGRPSWYIKAKEAGRPIWTDARTIRLGAEAFPGITYAAPFYDKDGKLLGVTTIDFNITTISEFLAKNKVGKAGFAFIIEKPVDGEPRVIAYPKPEILTRAVTDSRGRTQYEFVPTGNLGDDRVVRFMEKFSQSQSQASRRQSSDIRFHLRRHGLFWKLPSDDGQGTSGMDHRPGHSPRRDHGTGQAQQQADARNRVGELFRDPDRERVDFHTHLKASGRNRA